MSSLKFSWVAQLRPMLSCSAPLRALFTPMGSFLTSNLCRLPCAQLSRGPPPAGSSSPCPASRRPSPPECPTRACLGHLRRESQNCRGGRDLRRALGSVPSSQTMSSRRIHSPSSPCMVFFPTHSPSQNASPRRQAQDPFH